MMAGLRLARARLRHYIECMDTRAVIDNPCQSCGACCSYSEDWPRFTIEDEATLDLIPATYVNARMSGMRCQGSRCSALSGDVGIATSCSIYELRPEVCRTCLPGDVECNLARRKHELPPLQFE